MRKIIGSIVIVIVILVGFTGIKLKINDKKFNVPPYISNLFKSNELKDTSKEVQEKALDIVETVVDKTK